MTVYAVTPAWALPGTRGRVAGRRGRFDGREVWQTQNDAERAADVLVDAVEHDSRRQYIDLGVLEVVAVDADWDVDTWIPPAPEVEPATVEVMPVSRRLLRDAAYEVIG